MAIDLTKDLFKASTDYRDPKFDRMLSNLQGNILKGHGRNHTQHIFIQFDTNKLNKTKAWLKSFGKKKVTSCKKQLLETERFKRNGVSGDTFFGIYFTFAGYEYLLEEEVTKFSDGSFINGMKNAELNDPETTEWEAGFQETIHAMILIADSDENKLALAAKEIIQEIDLQLIPEVSNTAFAKICTIEYGNAIRNANGDGLEHFGYVDGISQPLFFFDEVKDNKDANTDKVFFDPSATLDLVLVDDPFVNKQDAFGSYFVFRKLEQRVRSFKTAEKELATKLDLQGDDAELAGAMIVGRFEDGTPVNMHKEAGMISSGITNNFNYKNDHGDENDGSKCPFHSHIRKANPRRDDNDKKHIMARRGIPYGRRDVSTEIDPSIPQMPDGGVGLLFMSFQKSIENQFEFIQKTWVNDVNFPSDRVDALDLSKKPPTKVTIPSGIDPIIGQDAHSSTNHGNTNKSTGAFASEYNNPATLSKCTFDQFVHLKGGEYFFAPSIAFLK